MKPKCKIIVSHLPYTLSPDILRSKLVLSFPDSDSVRDGTVNNYGNEMRAVTDSARALLVNVLWSFNSCVSRVLDI